MNTKFYLQNLTCANCALKIEKLLLEKPEIKEVNLNFATGLLRITWDHQFRGNHLELVEAIIKKASSKVVVTTTKLTSENNHNHQENNDSKPMIFNLIRLISGGIILVIAIILEAITEVNQTIILGIELISFIILGIGIIFQALKNLIHGKIFDEFFLMSIATIGAFAIGEGAEGAAVMLFYQIGELFQELSVNRAKRSIAQLMDIRPDYANFVDGEEVKKVNVEEVVVGSIIIVKPGEKIPLDGIVIDGSSSLDTAALTGESLPRQVMINDLVLSGSINLNGVLKIKVTQIYSQSTVAKIIDLVENASEKKAPTENFITKFAKVYTPIVVLLTVLIVLIPTLIFNRPFDDWFYRGLVFLVISCPCALVISIPLGFFGGIGGAARRGILIKGGNYLELLTKIKIAVLDKTGTITHGNFKVIEILATNGYSQQTVLAIAYHAEKYSNHPIGLSIKEAFLDLSNNQESLDNQDISQDLIIDQNLLIEDYQEISGQGIKVKLNNQIALVGNATLMEHAKIKYLNTEAIGTKVYVALNNQFIGSITISDQIKADSFQAINNFKKNGISQIIMLTGDNDKIAQVVAQKIAIDQYYSQLLPQDKVGIVKQIKDKTRQPLLFVGDGINDAPVLAMADLAIAMGGVGSAAAIEASDIVLMTDQLSKINEAIVIARFTKKVVWQNIILALGIKSVFLILGALGYATMWEAVFADVGVAVLAVVNAMRVLNIKKIKSI